VINWGSDLKLLLQFFLTVKNMKNEIRSSSLLVRLSGLYDSLFSENNIRNVERVIINFALAGFVLHLLVIFFSKHFSFGGFFPQLPSSYLKAIYTPFSIILFYEVLTLVVILPKSIVIFIGKQYEIITLIVIRSFFHDIAEYDLDKPDIYTLEFLKDISLDLVGALSLFFLTILYYRIFAKTKKNQSNPSLKRTRFIHIKKGAAVILSLLLLVLSLVSLFGWASDLYRVSTGGGHLPNPNSVFYKDFFSVMIFVDVFLLILSFIYSGTYDLIFRNGGFVISTILVRIALTAEKPFNIYFALVSLLFGVLLMALFVFYNQKKLNDDFGVHEDGE
jgi:hypothetical protein